MDNQQPSPFTLPLDALFETLEKAGFDTSPATRVRAWRVLEGLGREKFLRNPAALKTYLAPIFVRNAAEQERFYGIFDRAVEDWKKSDPDVELVDAPTRDLPPLKRWSVWGKPPLKRWSEFPIWGIMLIAVVLLGLAVFLWIQYRPAQKIILPEPDFAAQSDVYAEGDTVTTLNTTDLSRQDTSAYEFSWALERTDGRRELLGPTAPNWRFVVPASDTGAQRQIVLTLRHKPTGRQKSKYSSLVIACKTPPRLPKLILPAAVVPDKPQRFGLAAKPRRGFAYRWQIIGDTLFDAPAFNYTFTHDGTYEVSLVVCDTTQPGACTADTAFTIRVGDEKVTLPYKTLQTDKAEPVALYGWLTYLLMALLGMGMIWTWVKWAMRQAPAPDLPAPGLQTTPPGGWGSDKPPYFIPFREQKGVLRTSREQFRLGDALRMRQEGQHHVLDVRATLRATLDRGGYPTIRYRYLSRPTDYLFLVDEQLPGNHLARLFRHLAENLRGQDVALEMFWYDADFHRFWNRSLPEGTSLEGLQRLFPEHRLVLLGNGHQLVYQSTEGAPRLRPQLVASLRGWRDRLLLTPVLPEVWNWREGALFQQFPLFPADLRGLSDAAVFIETGLDAEDMPPSFWTWQERQRALRASDGVTLSHPVAKSAKTNTWKTAQDHETYLAPYAPDLMRWLRALAVTPSPVWETTLAIARALGIPVTHDRLLALARVPALQEGEWHPRLRRELLKTLDPDDERRARLAVREELEAVREQAKNSHAALDLESSLAVQQFIIDPDDEANQTLVLSLLDAGLLSRRQEEELDFAVARIGAHATTFRAWIDKPLPDAPPPPRPPFFTPMFWRAAALSLLFLLIFAFGWRYSGTAELRRMVFPEREFVPGVDTLRDAWWVQEDWVVDSALIYNNLGVKRNSEAINRFDPDFSPGISSFQISPESVAALFNRAQQLRAPAEYPLAKENLVKLWYNQGAKQLLSTGTHDLQRATLYFSRAQTLAGQQFPGHQMDAIHGNGVALFYTGLKDTATSFYDQLNATGYFDTLALRPNLETLLGIAQTRILNVTITNQSNSAVRTAITYQIGKKLSQNLYFTASAVDKTGKIIAFSQATLSHSKPGQYQDTYTFILLVAEPSKPAQADSLLIRLYDNDQRKTMLAQWKTAFDFKWSPTPAPEVIPPNPVTPESTPQQLPIADRDKDGTPDDKDNCPDDPYKTEPGACGCGKPDTDTDGDGVPDCNDECPNEKGEAANKGCPPPVAAADLSAILAEINRNMISVRGGTFTMGCTKEQGEDCYDNEKPAHLVTVSNFAIGKTEVTNEQFFAFMNDIAPKLMSSDGDDFQYDGKDFYLLLKGTISWQKGRFVIKKGFEQHPIARMSWYAATEYCHWLAQKTGKKYRLPTEAEWEFAARGGNNSKKTKYAGSDNIEEVAWYADNSGSDTHPVGQKQPNELGIFDLSGNVWEWCSDLYGDYQDTGKPVLNPIGAVKGMNRVYRGGVRYLNALGCRTAYRSRAAPDDRFDDRGFRLVLAL